MFIVVPYLSKEPSIYGIYTVCISITIFLAYADLGFLQAGNKYAAESYGRGEQGEEVKIIGFTAFVLLLFVCTCAAIFFYLGCNPHLLIRGLKTHYQMSVASELLFILAFFSPLIVVQRITEMIFGIRLDNYINQRINIGANLLKILSVLYFFRVGSYKIVEYYLFSQILNAVALALSMIIVKTKYNYDLKLLIKSTRFNLAIYKKVNKLAFPTLLIMISWILYWELDAVVIGKYIGPEKVAIFAIGLTLISFLRSIFGILYNPFNARFNHLVGLKSTEALKNMVLQLIILTTPLVLIPVVAIGLVSDSLVLSWVGGVYTDSISIARVLVLVYVFSSITYPASILIMAEERIKPLYFFAIITPLIYWIGIYCFYPLFGLQTFAVFKFIAVVLPLPYYVYYLVKFLNISLFDFIKQVFTPIIIPIIFLILSLLVINNYLPFTKSKINLFIVCSVTSCIIIIAFFIQYLVSYKIRNQVSLMLSSIKA